jgi:hypothetical protein
LRYAAPPQGFVDPFGRRLAALSKVKREAEVAYGSIVLKKSKIARLRKSREDQFLIVSAAASRFSMGAAVSDRFCGNPCGPFTSPRSGRAGSAKKFRSSTRKVFFNTIGQMRKWTNPAGS